MPGVTFTADLGQGEKLDPARRKDRDLGSAPENIFIDDRARGITVRDFVFPMFRANGALQGRYLLGTSIARPLLSKRLVEIAEQVGADAVSHGATGKGQRPGPFELAAYAPEPRNPGDRALAGVDPLSSRTKLLEFAEEHQISHLPRGTSAARRRSPWTRTFWHTSSEGKVLENPGEEAPDSMSSSAPDDPETAPDTPQMVEITFEKGDAVAIDGEAMSPATLLTRLNEMGKVHGVGRLDLVENRFVGMKSRGVYETPGGTILLEAHRGNRAESRWTAAGPGTSRTALMPR